MSIQVENNLKKDENTEIFQQRAHYMACSIASDGPANINKYFEPYISLADENGGKQYIENIHVLTYHASISLKESKICKTLHQLFLVS